MLQCMDTAPESSAAGAVSSTHSLPLAQSILFSCVLCLAESTADQYKLRQKQPMNAAWQHCLSATLCISDEQASGQKDVVHCSYTCTTKLQYLYPVLNSLAQHTER